MEQIQPSRKSPEHSRERGNVDHDAEASESAKVLHVAAAVSVSCQSLPMSVGG